MRGFGGRGDARVKGGIWAGRVVEGRGGSDGGGGGALGAQWERGEWNAGESERVAGVRRGRDERTNGAGGGGGGGATTNGDGAPTGRRRSTRTQTCRRCSRSRRARTACCAGTRAPGTSRPASCPSARPTPSPTGSRA